MGFYDATFPQKTLFTCKGPQLEDRRIGLELWVQRVVGDPRSQPGQPWYRPLHNFLAEGRLAIAAAPVDDPPIPSVPSESNIPTTPSGNIPSSTSGQTLPIVVPNGVAAGQVIAVTVPGSGQQVNIEVPAGHKGGSELKLWWDAAAGK